MPAIQKLRKQLVLMPPTQKMSKTHQTNYINLLRIIFMSNTQFLSNNKTTCTIKIKLFHDEI